jgi:DNA mismatch repair protein MutS
MPPTQVMQQYLDAKRQAGDALLLFRLGDFYELFHEDARTASRILNIALTTRDKGPDAVPMAGFPHHALEVHLRKLLEAGVRVAVCEQMEEASQAKGVIRREIARVVTPGTLTDETLLDPGRNNYLLALVPAAGADGFGAAWVDLSSNVIEAADLDALAVHEEFCRLEPSEVLIPEEFEPPSEWLALVRKPAMTRRPASIFRTDAATRMLHEHFGVRTLEGFGVADGSPAARAAGALLHYLKETQRSALSHLARLRAHQRARTMLIDAATRRSLEITRTLRDGVRSGSLLDAIDRTATCCGARRLASWLNQPLTDVTAIRLRHAAVAEWKGDPVARESLRELLRKTSDVERLAGRIATGRVHPRDLVALRETLRLAPQLKAKLAGRNARLNAEIEAGIALMPGLRTTLEAALADDPPYQLRDGGVIRSGFSAELDELREAAKGGKQWLASYQRQEIDRTGITNLKVNFNKVFGFYLEVPNSGRAKVPDDYQRRQTVKNAERYVTPELKDYERKVLGAEERVLQLEAELFRELREAAAGFVADLHQLASSLADLDVVVGLAEIAAERNYVRPEVVETDEFLVEAGRHPVLDAKLKDGLVVPNDLRLGSSMLGGDGPRFLLITGPNMAGKSTYIRQAALLALMAQAGSFVPATAATIGVVDRLFTRVGASDELGRGQSTFMVEMTETANILNNATPRSLVVLDEIGRGTSTYDGVSLAWAVAEHLHDRVGCRTLFATHYHELIDLERTLTRLKNLSVAVREWKEDVLFLHQIVEGGADRSYGIHVARLAGVPTSVLQRAQQVLDQLERDPFGERSPQAVKGQPRKHRRQYHQLPLFPPAVHPVVDALSKIDAAALPPADAVELLKRLAEDARK